MRKFWKTLNIIYERCLLAVFVCVLLIVLYCMYDMYYVFEHAGSKDLLKYKPTASGYDAAASPISEDMIAWLTLHDTNIDYPVMQGKSNTEYLNKDPYGDYSLSGSIFLDCRNDAEFMDEYSILYGHHMEYGKMFGALDSFLNADYLAAHSYGTLLVGRNGYKQYTLKIFAAMRGSARNNDIFDPKAGKEILRYIKANAAVFTEERPNRIVAMSTCNDSDSAARVLVFAYIIE